MPVANLVSLQSQEDQHPWPRRQQLEVVEDFTYLGSTISSNLSLHSELNKRIGKPVAALCLSHLRKRALDNTMFTISTKIQMYQASVLSTLLYGRET